MNDRILFELNVQLSEGGCAWKSFRRSLPHDATRAEVELTLGGMASEANRWIDDARNGRRVTNTKDEPK